MFIAGYQSDGEGEENTADDESDSESGTKSPPPSVTEQDSEADSAQGDDDSKPLINRYKK